jgi:hypothetical protein
MWLQEASAWQPDAPALPRAVSVHAAAGPRLEAAVSVHAAAEPQLEAASVPWAQQVAAEVSDGSRAARLAVSGVTARQPAEVRRADAAVRPPVAVRSVPWAQQAAAASPGARPAAVPLALPSAAASVFRQGPSLLSGPAPPRAAARFAHATRSLRIASQS